jgi:hypothetical protein
MSETDLVSHSYGDSGTAVGEVGSDNDLTVGRRRGVERKAVDNVKRIAGEDIGIRSGFIGPGKYNDWIRDENSNEKPAIVIAFDPLFSSVTSNAPLVPAFTATGCTLIITSAHASEEPHWSITTSSTTQKTNRNGRNPLSCLIRSFQSETRSRLMAVTDQFPFERHLHRLRRHYRSRSCPQKCCSLPPLPY